MGLLMRVEHLFPEPVYFSNLDRALTKTELKTIAQYKEKTSTNQGNLRTHDSYVLKHKTFKNLKKALDQKIINYFNKIICCTNTTLPYITQSWINYTKENQFHHRHAHPNSYVSGVFYIDADKEVDKISFFRSGYSTFLPTVTQFNIFNSTTATYPVQGGDVLLFPSSLHHGVNSKKGTNIRTSLSFNVFFKGAFGSKKDLAELIIE
jgi:uncharacterized protein (TIGR02466 family)